MHSLAQDQQEDPQTSSPRLRRSLNRKKYGRRGEGCRVASLEAAIYKATEVPEQGPSRGVGATEYPGESERRVGGWGPRREAQHAAQWGPPGRNCSENLRSGTSGT